MRNSDYSISSEVNFWEEIFSQVELYIRRNQMMGKFQKISYVFDKNKLYLKEIRVE